MIYNQTKVNGVAMPPLMGCNKTSDIVVLEEKQRYLYNPLFSFLTVITFATIVLSSCKTNYQKISTEFIRSLPDSCEFLVAVDNDTEHLVYYKGSHNNAFFCYNVETESVEELKVPEVESLDCVPFSMGAGVDNILVAYSDVDDISSASCYSNANVHIYNLKTKTFEKLLECNGCIIDKGKKQLICYTYDTNRYGEGTRNDEIYDFDGKLLSKKEVEVIDNEEVPTGTLAAREREAQQEEERANQSNNSFFNSNQSSQRHFYCELCGAKYSTPKDLLNNSCLKNKVGMNIGRHVLYEGGEKSIYTCRYCGKQYSSIKDMVFNSCPRREFGEKHAPAR